jgi:Peptidase_C39 like family
MLPSAASFIPAASWAIALVLLVTPCHSLAEPISADAFRIQAETGRLKRGLDKLVDMPAVWSLTPNDLDKAFAVPAGIRMTKNPFFNWMTKSHDRAVFMRQPFADLKIDFTLFDGSLPVEEVVVDFIDDKLNGITFSLYNRGDSGKIDQAGLEKRMKLCEQRISAILGVQPGNKKANPTQGLLADGRTWTSGKGLATLEFNPEALDGKPEFLRLRIAPRNSRGIYAAAFQNRFSAVKVSELPQNVVRKSGDVFIKGIPMVDQGPKGYCVVASAQRLMEYYGIPADQHQIAQVVASDSRRGTSALAMSEALGRIDYRFKTRFKIHAMKHQDRLVMVDERRMAVGRDFSETQFTKLVRSSIDDGIPLLWALVLGMYPEEPAISLQTGGGHMRMIIGYNLDKKHIIFTDSWGAGHEMKRMSLDHAYKASQGLFTMTPTVR